MEALRRGVDDVTNESFRIAVLVGLATVPFTVVLSGRPESHVIAGGPVFLAGLAVGYVYSDRPISSRRAGVYTGLAAAIGVGLWQCYYMASVAWAGSAAIALLTAILTPIVLLVGVGLAVLVASIGTIVGDRVAAKYGRVRGGEAHA